MGATRCGRKRNDSSVGRRLGSEPMQRTSSTEHVHPASLDLERLSAHQILIRLHAGDRQAARAVGRALSELARVAEAVALALGAGGRLLYAGAGTAGRLGALDAAECPPTFGVSPSRVVALVAGGNAALRRSVEGAEDDAQAGAAAVGRARVGARDVLIGVSASGTTPFTLAAVREARRRGAITALVTSNPEAKARVDHRIVLDTGPELVAGSTRLKAGTAAKMALNLLSTAAFIQLGAVHRGRMIDLRASNAKLRRRAIDTVVDLAGCTLPAARRLLSQTDFDVRAALERLGVLPERRAGRPRG